MLPLDPAIPSLPFIPQRNVAVYNSPLSTPVMMRPAPKPEGPWSREVMAFTALAPAAGASPVDDAQAPPQLNADGGQTMFVTYSHATGPFRSEFHLVSVQLQLAGSQTQSATTFRQIRDSENEPTAKSHLSY